MPLRKPWLVSSSTLDVQGKLNQVCLSLGDTVIQLLDNALQRVTKQAQDDVGQLGVSILHGTVDALDDVIQSRSLGSLGT